MSTHTTNNTTTGGGISFLGALFLVFLVLKLTGTISWSWWWVTAPLWGGAALSLGIFVIVALVGLIAFGAQEAGRAKRRRR